MEDIRWQQRFSNYQKALARLSEAVNVLNECDNVGSEQDLLKEGLIQRFESTPLYSPQGQEYTST